MRDAVFLEPHDVDGRAKAIDVYFVGRKLAEMRNSRRSERIVAE